VEGKLIYCIINIVVKDANIKLPFLGTRFLGYIISVVCRCTTAIEGKRIGEMKYGNNLMSCMDL
jgi:hypothetical protein